MRVQHAKQGWGLGTDFSGILGPVPLLIKIIGPFATL